MGLRGHRQRQAGVNRKKIDPANTPILPLKEEDIAAMAVIDGTYVGASRPEYYLKKLGSATQGAGIRAPLVAEAPTTMLQAECKR
jgi:hypothetical protein